MPDLDDIRWDWGAEVGPGAGILESPLDGGPLHVEQVQPVDRRTWTLGSRQLSTAEAGALRTIWAGCRGRAGTTTLTPPGEVSPVAVEFVDDALTLRWVTGGTWETQIRVREVL